MAMDKEKVLDKVEKLLRLAQSSNVNEAGLAAARAQELMDKYNLSMSDVEANELSIEDPIEDVQVSKKGKSTYDSFQEPLLSALAEHNHCRLYINIETEWKNRRRSKRRVLRVVGHGGDVRATVYLYKFIRSEINRYARRDCSGLSRKFHQQFRIGALHQICEMLYLKRKAMKAEMAGQVSETAMVRFDDRQNVVEDWISDKLNLRSSRPRRQRSPDYRAQQMGANAARAINLDTKPALGKGKDRLSS